MKLFQYDQGKTNSSHFRRRTRGGFPYDSCARVTQISTLHPCHLARGYSDPVLWGQFPHGSTVPLSRVPQILGSLRSPTNARSQNLISQSDRSPSLQKYSQRHILFHVVAALYYLRQYSKPRSNRGYLGGSLLSIEYQFLYRWRDESVYPISCHWFSMKEGLNTLHFWPAYSVSLCWDTLTSSCSSILALSSVFCSKSLKTLSCLALVPKPKAWVPSFYPVLPHSSVISNAFNPQLTEDCRQLITLDFLGFFGTMLIVLKKMLKETALYFMLLFVIITGFLQGFVAYIPSIPG